MAQFSKIQMLLAYEQSLEREERAGREGPVATMARMRIAVLRRQLAAERAVAAEEERA